MMTMIMVMMDKKNVRLTRCVVYYQNLSGCTYVDTSTGYGLFIRVKLVRVERSRSLVQADTCKFRCH